ncbi:MAG: DUF1987 domain-containing protein [Bacteroidota bacterium]
MEPLIINNKNTKFLKILFDKDENTFIINGNSLPENATLFFTPVHEWLSEYKLQANSESILHLYLNYYNTSSSKHLLKIFFHFKDIMTRGNKVLVKWYGSEEADYVEEAEIYQSLVDIPFEFIEEVPDFSKFFK